jgi:ribose 5-phosphate isomerase B
MKDIKIALGADHAGFQLKNEIKEWLIQKGFEVLDKGVSSGDSVDYPDFASVVSKEVSNSSARFGVLVCGSGIGMCMTANRYKNVRAVVIQDEKDAKLSRQHNDANVACFGARFIDFKKAVFFLDIFFNTDFEKGRHENRVRKMDL